MQYAGFFSEIFESPIVAVKEGLQKYLPYFIAHQQGKILDFPERAALEMRRFGIESNQFLNKEDKPENSVAVIPISGLMTRSGSWWDYGTDDIAELMKQAFADESIKAVVLRVNSIGGITDSGFPLKAAFKIKNKPVIGAIDAKAYSMGYYAVSFADKIFAVDDMAGLGSIGIMARIEDWDEVYKKQYGLNIVEIYPPESKWKNKPEREALKGKTKLLVDEVLSPWAKHFQELVRKNRKKLNEEVEGVLEGRTFFARDSKPDGNGLIDGIMTFDEIVNYAANYERNDKLTNFFNK